MQARRFPHAVLIVLAFGFALGFSGRYAHAADNRPNFMVILCDDLGHVALTAAVFGFPVASLEAALNVETAALFHVLVDYFGESAERHDIVELNLTLLLPIEDLRDRGVAGAGVRYRLAVRCWRAWMGSGRRDLDRRPAGGVARVERRE